MSLATELKYCCTLGLMTVAIMAPGQSDQTEPIHVNPEDSKAGVRVSLKPLTPVATSPEAPKLFAALRSANGIDPQLASPWHAELTYDEFDGDGDNVHSGTIEEYYVSPKKYRTITKTDEFAQTEVANGSDLYRIGNQDWPPATTLQAARTVLEPLSDLTIGGQGRGNPDQMDWKVGSVVLPCVVIRNFGTIISDNGLPKFCYERGTMILRYAHAFGWDETVYNNIVLFQKRYYARDAEVTHSGKPFLKIHLAKIEPLPQIDESLFATPADSPGPLAGLLTVPSRVLMKDYLLPNPSPHVPHFLKGVHGKVTVKFNVDKDGRVIHSSAIDGPEELRKPAEQEVQQYEFRPFFILGKAVEVQSTMVYNIQ
jgi:hypothetical protein